MFRQRTLSALLVFLPLFTAISFAGGKEKPNLPTPSRGKSLIVVYGKHGYGCIRVGCHVTIFGNENFLAQLHRGEYGYLEVSPGRATLTAPAGMTSNWGGAGEPRLSLSRGNTSYPPPQDSWPGRSACADLDWRHLSTANPAAALSCEKDLTSSSWGYRSSSREDVRAHDEQVELLLILRGMTKLLTTANEEVISGHDLAMVSRSAKSPLLEIEVEPEKTYFVEYSIGAKTNKAGGAMRVVDEVSGEKDIRGLRIAQYR